MRRSSPATGRARWLAEVAQALEEAKATVEALGVMAGGEGDCGGDRGGDRGELIERIDAAQLATRSLQLCCDRRLERGDPPF